MTVSFGSNLLHRLTHYCLDVNEMNFAFFAVTYEKTAYRLGTILLNVFKIKIKDTFLTFRGETYMSYTEPHSKANPTAAGGNLVLLSAAVQTPRDFPGNRAESPSIMSATNL